MKNSREKLVKNSGKKSVNSLLLNALKYGIISFVRLLVKAWLRGQAVKTSPFHGGNTGSIPVGVIWRADMAQLAER